MDDSSDQLLKDEIKEVLSTLTPSGQRVLQLHFGLEDGKYGTLEECGLELLLRENVSPKSRLGHKVDPVIQAGAPIERISGITSHNEIDGRFIT